MFGIPHSTLLWTGGIVLAFSLGATVGTRGAIKTALDTAYDHSAREMAAATGALIKQRKTEKAADAKAHQTYTANLRAARRGRDTANAALAAKQKELDNALASSDGCVLPGDVRRVLDTATGARVEPDRGGAVPTGGIERAAAESPALTCWDLAYGYVALGEHALKLSGQINAILDFEESVAP